MATAQQPIGIFDSGIGGLTVARVLCQRLPNEQIIYVGDNAHMPYGGKSAAAIEHYAIKITETLLQKDCKMILIACHTASAVAFNAVRDYVGDCARVVNVVEPVLNYIAQHPSLKNPLLIATRATVDSQIYQKNLELLCPHLKLTAIATPLFAPLIEEGFTDCEAVNLVLSRYLKSVDLATIDALILGCTHYPLVQEVLATLMPPKVNIIDPAELVVDQVQQWLADQNLLNQDALKTAQHFYLTDYTQNFVTTAKGFFAGDIQIERFPLWD